MASPKFLAMITVFLVFILTLTSITNGALQISQTIPFSGVIGSSETFQMRGTTVGLDDFISGNPDYQPNAWALLQNLRINEICVSGGSYGDVAHFNMVNYPNEWAQNLNNFLSKASERGMVVYFKELGNQWKTLFGIVSPSDQYSQYTPIDTAKIMVDELAGNNSLHHDFITDPRIFGWCPSNEPNIANTTVLNWNIQMLDYIRSLGSKAWIESPYYDGVTDWNETVSLLGSHMDYLEFHMYGVSAFVNNPTYQAFFNWYNNTMYWNFKAENFSWPISKVIFGEFGIGEGYNTEFGGSNVTDIQRIAYYAAVMDVAKSWGITNIEFFMGFPIGIPTDNFGVVDQNGNPYPVYYFIQSEFGGT